MPISYLTLLIVSSLLGYALYPYAPEAAAYGYGLILISIGIDLYTHSKKRK